MLNKSHEKALSPFGIERAIRRWVRVYRSTDILVAAIATEQPAIVQAEEAAAALPVRRAVVAEATANLLPIETNKQPSEIPPAALPQAASALLAAELDPRLQSGQSQAQMADDARRLVAEAQAWVATQGDNDATRLMSATEDWPGRQK